MSVAAPDGARPPVHADPLVPVKGPSAIGADLRRMSTLTWTFAVTDFKLKFFGSILGYLWQLMRPLLLFTVLYFVFTEFVRLGNDVPYYSVVLITNIVLFTYFAETTGNAVGSLVDRENVVRKVHFPRLAIPLSIALGASFNLALNIVVIFIFLFANGIEPRWTWLELPVLIGMLATFATGFAMLLSALYVRARDVRPIWEVTLQAVFYATPVIYVIEHIPRESLQSLILLNPLAIIMQQTRHALIDPTTPGAVAIAGWGHVAFAAAFVIGIFAAGFMIFSREAPRIAEDL
jgi:ABC-2 type transport system permease protein